MSAVFTALYIVKQQGFRAPTRCKASRKGGVVIVKQQGSRAPTRCKASRKGEVLIKINERKDLTIRFNS